MGGDWAARETDSEGRATFRLPAGRWEIVAMQGEQAIVPTAQEITGSTVSPQVVRLKALGRTQSLRGRVRFQSPWPEDVYAEVHRTLTAVASPADPREGRWPVASSPVDEDGEFVLNVPPGRWRIGLREVIGVGVETGNSAESPIHIDLDLSQRTGVIGLLGDIGLGLERIGPPFSFTVILVYAIGPSRRLTPLYSTWARDNNTYGIYFVPPVEGTLAVTAWRPGAVPVPAAARIVPLALGGGSLRPGTIWNHDFRFITASGTVEGEIIEAPDVQCRRGGLGGFGHRIRGLDDG